MTDSRTDTQVGATGFQSSRPGWLAAVLLLLSVLPLAHAAEVESQRGLKDHFAKQFPIGVAVSVQNLSGDERDLILKEFNSLTPENSMKMGVIHPEEDRYDWTEADRIAQFATDHGLKLRGHALLWHEQVGNWMFKDKDRGRPSRELILSRLKAHIEAVVGRYKGRIYAWDVVNESISDESDGFLRKTEWYEICGFECIAKAFEYAHAADPEAKLFYNDYNTEIPEKRERIYRLLQKLVQAHVPIDGVGLQAHWSIYEPTEKELDTAIKRYSSLGLQIQITELDVSIYPWEKTRRSLRQGESDVLTPELERQQSEKYRKLVKVILDHKNVFTGITFWNVSDRNSWLNSYPVAGRKNYPTLFDRNLRRKPAYDAFIEWVREKRD